MRARKHLGAYVLLVVVLGLLLTVCAHDRVTDCGLRALGKPGSTEFFALSQSDTHVAALGRQGDRLVLAIGDTESGKRESCRRLPTEYCELLVSQMQLLEDGTVLLAGYRLEETETTKATLEILAIDGQEITLIATFPGEGSTVGEQIQSKSCSAFVQSGTDGWTRFAVWADGLCQVYHYDAADRSLILAGSTRAEAESGVRVSEGDTLEPCPVPTEEPLLSLWQEDPLLTVCGEEGTWLYLEDHTRLFALEEAELTELTNCIQQSRPMAIVSLAALVLGVLVLAFALWYLFCYSRRMTLSLLLRDGFWLLVLLAVGLGCLTQLFLRPAWEQRAAEAANRTLCTLSALAPETLTQEQLNQLVSSAAAADTAYSVLQATVYQRVDGTVYPELASSDRLLPTGDCTAGMQLQPLLAQAQEMGTAFVEQSARGKNWYILATPCEEGILVLRLGAWTLQEQAQADCRSFCAGLWCLGAVIYLLLLLELGRIRRGIRRVISGMDHLSQGHRQVRVQQSTGDELEALGVSFNAMADYVDGVVQGENRLDTAYLRFLPHQIFHLLGAESVTEVDKSSFAVKQLTTMMVSIRFPEEVYNSGKRDLFDKINAVLEHTAMIVSKNGGTIFNITYESFDAVFEADPRQTVSTAVAIRQEMLAMNRERESRGKPVATVHIALDAGNVMLGVVGDETRMVPVAVSESLKAARRMISLCDKLDASILCTQGMIDSAQEYRSRYVGKSRVGDELLRIYEIYDGDYPSVIADKDASQSQFSEGIFSMYAGDCAKAKRIFMDIARHCFRDGAARYYLYLADRAEQVALQEISLDD